MATLTTRQLVTRLQQQGYNVTFRVRKDGGILITSINGSKFSGAKGNIQARTLLGEKISERREAQLKKITRERVKTPRKIPIETPEDLERYRKRVMRKWRKAGLKGSISKRNLRKIIEDRGFTGALNYLKEMERHSEGKAYLSAIEGLISRIEQDLLIEDDEWLSKALDLIEENKENFKQEWLFNIFDSLYEVERGVKSSHDFYIQLENLFKE